MTTASLLRVAALVFIATSFVVFGDTAGKLLTSQGTDPFFVAWTRFAIGAALFLPFSGLTRAELPQLLCRPILLRGLLVTCGITSILTALKTAPIADVFGAFFIGPIVSYVLAVLFLNEQVTRARTLLLGLGFAGVMLVVKPGFGATPGIAFALLAGCCYGGYLASTKHISGRFRPRFLLISQLLVGSVVLAPFGLSAVPSSVDINATLLIGLSALGSGIGNYLLVRANRMATASLIAPLIYTQLVTATAMSLWVFHDPLDPLSLAGLLLILLSGIGSLAITRQIAGVR